MGVEAAYFECYVLYTAIDSMQKKSWLIIYPYKYFFLIVLSSSYNFHVPTRVVNGDEVRSTKFHARILCCIATYLSDYCLIYGHELYSSISWVLKSFLFYFIKLKNIEGMRFENPVPWNLLGDSFLFFELAYILTNDSLEASEFAVSKIFIPWFWIFTIWSNTHYILSNEHFCAMFL